MDLGQVLETRNPRTREETVLRPGECYMSGGTWLYSEPQPGISGIVDLMACEWPDYELTPQGLSVASTCTIRAFSRIPDAGWRAHPLLYQCCTALYGSFKVWNVATVGGNICAALPPGPMTTIGAGLDAHGVIWRPDGTDRTMPIAQLVTGLRTTALEPGEMLRSIEFPLHALRANTAYRKIAIAEIGRSGAVLVARHEIEGSGAFVLTITASTLRPVVLRYPAIPTATELQNDIDDIELWYTDPHGAADWREHMSRVLAEQLRVELLERAGHTDETGGMSA